MQVAQLTGLLSLTLVDARHTAAGLAPLSALTGLESLSLEGCSALPPAAALAELSSLKALQLLWCGRRAACRAAAPQPATAGDSSLAQERPAGSPAASGSCGTGSSRSRGSVTVDSGWQQPACCGRGISSGDSEAALLQAALRSFHQLTLLCFASTQQHPTFPAALAGLARLQRFDWGGPPPMQPMLPPGPWLARLRSAALPADTTAASLAVLSAAWRLESLEVVGRTAGTSPPHPEIVRWAARHPPLGCLALPPSAAAASSSSRHSPSSSGDSSTSSSAAGTSLCGSPSSASTAASGGGSCGSSRGSQGLGDVGLEVALQEARELRPGLVVLCH